jgi:hypothetical protein
VPVHQDHGNESLKSDKGFKKCCISDEMNGTEDEDEVQNVGSEHGSVSSECMKEDGNRKALKLRTMRGMVKLNKGLVTSRRKLTQ